MATKKQVALLVATIIILLAVIASAACVMQATDTASLKNPTTAGDTTAAPKNVSIVSSQQLNLTTGEKSTESSLKLDVAKSNETDDYYIFSFTADPEEILENQVISSMRFTTEDKWVLETLVFIGAIYEHIREAGYTEPVDLYLILYEYDAAGNRVYLRDTKITISPDDVSLGTYTNPFELNSDVFASGEYELVISPYPGLDQETLNYTNPILSTWYKDSGLTPNVLFSVGSDALPDERGIFTDEANWVSISENPLVLPALPWGFAQTIITATPTVVPVYDSSENYTVLALDMPWRLHWTLNNVPYSKSTTEGIDSKQKTKTVETTRASVKGEEEPEEGEDPAEDETATPTPTKTATPTATPTKNATATPTATPAKNATNNATTTENAAPAPVTATYYNNVEFLLYKYENGQYQLYDRFGWNGGYSSDKEQYTKSYYPGTYTLITYLRGVGVTLDFQKYQSS